eukprot:6965346-Prymnesium_polylepis.1
MRRRQRGGQQERAARVQHYSGPSGGGSAPGLRSDSHAIWPRALTKWSTSPLATNPLVRMSLPAPSDRTRTDAAVPPALSQSDWSLVATLSPTDYSTLLLSKVERLAQGSAPQSGGSSPFSAIPSPLSLRDGRRGARGRALRGGGAGRGGARGGGRARRQDDGGDGAQRAAAADGRADGDAGAAVAAEGTAAAGTAARAGQVGHRRRDAGAARGPQGRRRMGRPDAHRRPRERDRPRERHPGGEAVEHREPEPEAARRHA